MIGFSAGLTSFQGEYVVRYLLLCVVILLTGCTTMKFNGAELHGAKIEEPPVGQEVTASTGDQILHKEEVEQQHVLQVNKTIDGLAYDIPKGDYEAIGHDEENDYYLPEGIIKNFFAERPSGLMLGKAPGSKLCVLRPGKREMCYSGDYERRKEISKLGENFRQTLIYNGRFGNNIKIGYREFNSEKDKQIISNEVEYDLSVSNIIVYKGAKLEVISANNNSITYRVINSFN